MSNRKVVSFIVLGAAAVTLAGYSAFAQRSSRAMAADQPADLVEPQISNRAAKANRLVVQAALTSTENTPVYVLASASPDIDLERATNPALPAAPAISDEEPAPAPLAAEPKQSAVPVPQDKPNDKPKRLPPPPAAPASSGLLDDGQINGLKGRLRLTSDQAGYWPAVEAALRDVARTHLRGSLKQNQGGRANIDVNSPEVQKLIWAAMPLLMRLREDQKSEVRKLARVIGLEQVASQI